MIEVNLLPETQKETRSRKRRSRRPTLPSVKLGDDPWLKALVAALVLVPGVVLAFWLFQRAEARGLEERLASATADSARLADLRAVSDSLLERQRVIRERVALIEQLDNDRFVWPRIMDEVSRALPELAWVTNIRQLSRNSDLRFQIQGVAGNPLVITDFVRNLEASAYLRDIRILGSQQQEIEEFSVQAFTLTARYRQPVELERRVPIVPPTGD